MAQRHLANFGMTIGDGAPLWVIAGLNVLEDLDLARAVAAHLRGVCAELHLPFVFKASFDKANRSSIRSYRGPGFEAGLAQLAAIRAEFGVPICTDYHEAAQAEPVAVIADLLQVPAFLARQTDIVIAGAKAVAAQGGLLHVKKAQFMAPSDAKNILDKVGEAASPNPVILCERGVSFGYNNLVVDMTGIPLMQQFGAPVTIDATHAAQLPGADPRSFGASTGGRREAVPVIAKAAVAAGADGVFLEFHPDPDRALCDGPSCLPLAAARPLLSTLKRLFEATRAE